MNSDPITGEDLVYHRWLLRRWARPIVSSESPRFDVCVTGNEDGYRVLFVNGEIAAEGFEHELADVDLMGEVLKAVTPSGEVRFSFAYEPELKSFLHPETKERENELNEMLRQEGLPPLTP